MIDLLGAWGEASAEDMRLALGALFARVADTTSGPHLAALLRRVSSLETPESMVGTAFDQAAIWGWTDLADELSTLRDRLLPSSPSWTSSPELDTWERSARWWSRRVALVCLLGMRMQPDQAAGLAAAARQVVEASAWRSSEPAGRSTVLTLYTWALQQSPIPPGASWTRRLLVNQAEVAGYRKPGPGELIWEGGKEGIENLVPDSPGEIAGVAVGLGLLGAIFVIAMAGPAATLAGARRAYAAGHR